MINVFGSDNLPWVENFSQRFRHKYFREIFRNAEEKIYVSINYYVSIDILLIHFDQKQ